MALEDWVRTLRNRCQIHDDDTHIVDELNIAIKWAWQKAFLVNTNLQLTFETTGTFGAITENYDANTYGIKAFWVKNPTDTEYVQVIFMDGNDPRFLARTQMDPQLIQPTYATKFNFDSIRFAPALPAGMNYRVDWIDYPPVLSMDTNINTLTLEPIELAVLSYAEGLLWRGQDDTRSGEAMAEAHRFIGTSIKTLKQRQFSTKQKTKPFPRR